MRKIVLLTCLTLSSLSSVRAATCKNADFAGVWQLYTVFDSVAHCTLVVSKDASIADSSSCSLLSVNDSIALNGTLTLTRNCHVAGTINTNGQNHVIDAWISKDKNSLSGITWKPGNLFAGNVLSGVKQ